MKSITLKASLRKELGKKAAKEIRKNGMIPCVLYGGKDHIDFQTESKAFKNVIYTPDVYVVNVDIEGDVHQAVIKELQMHPTSDEPVHVDFLEISDDKPIVIDMPLKTSGSSIGVREGGKLAIEKRKIRLKGLVKDIPDVVVLDISTLGVGRSIKAGDIDIASVEVMMPKGTPIVSVRATRATATAEEQPAAAE